MGASVNIALPAIGKEFSLDAVLLSWVATSYFLATAMFLVPFGKIADIYGRKKIFLYGVLFYTFSSLLCGLSNSAVMLILFRILQGLGSAMIAGTGIAILTSVFPPRERGKVLGINVAAVYLGLTLGPFLGGFLTQHLGWRSIFFINVPLGLIIVLFIFWKLKAEWAEAKGESFDFVGSVFYSISLVAVMYGFSLLPHISGFTLVLIGILVFLLFLKWELKVETPVLDIKLFKSNTAFAFSNFAAFLNYSATFSVSFLLSLYLQYIKAITPQKAGLILAFQSIVMAIFSPFAGRLSDRFEPRIIASIGMMITDLSLLLFIFLSSNTPLMFIIGNLMLLGLGVALFASPNTNAVMSAVERKFYGVASAIRGTMRLVGQVFSMGIAMLIFSIHIGKVQINPQNYSKFLISIKTAFTVFTILCFIGIFASLAKGNN
ncbi:MAG: MFS transporter [Thermodesulfobacteria bacterium]|nr:MFS transporter [Thermodesulfobacteriota bacterium]